MDETRLVLLPFPRKEDEAVELHAEAEEWDIFERFLEDDIDVPVHFGRVCHPPKVEPIRVELVIVSDIYLSVKLRVVVTWWFAIITKRLGKSHSTRPSGVFLI